MYKSSTQLQTTANTTVRRTSEPPRLVSFSKPQFSPAANARGCIPSGQRLRCPQDGRRKSRKKLGRGLVCDLEHPRCWKHLTHPTSRQKSRQGRPMRMAWDHCSPPRGTAGDAGLTGQDGTWGNCGRRRRGGTPWGSVGIGRIRAAPDTTSRKGRSMGIGRLWALPVSAIAWWGIPKGVR